MYYLSPIYLPTYSIYLSIYIYYLSIYLSIVCHPPKRENKQAGGNKPGSLERNLISSTLSGCRLNIIIQSRGERK